MPFTSKFSQLRGFEVPALREGVPTLFGAPLARTPADLAGADIAVIGIPYDRIATAGRDPGAWAGYFRAAEVTRQNSLRFAGFLPELELDVFEHLRLVDYGDVAYGADLEANIAATIAKVKEVIAAGCRPITLGGFSPLASYAVARAIAESAPGWCRAGISSAAADAAGGAGARNPLISTGRSRG